MNPDTPDTFDDHRNGAFVVVRRKSDGAILIGDALYGSKLGTLPGGGIFENETPRQAALRELREEFGVSLATDHLRHWGSFAQRARRHGSGDLVGGLLLAFEARVDLVEPPHHENEEIANQRFVPIEKIFLAGNVTYGITCLRLVARYLLWEHGLALEVEAAMRDPVTVTLQVGGKPRDFVF